MEAGRHLISRLTPLASIPRFSLIAASRSSSSIHLRPLAAAGDAIVRRMISTSANGSGLRCFSTRPTVSSLNDPSPNFSNRPPKETILLDGCDFEHWLVVVDPPDPNLTRDEIIDSYIKTLAEVVGSEDEARMKIYSVSTKHYFAFGALVSEELSYKIKTLPKVRWVLPDSYLDVKNKDYGGEPFIDGKAVPYDPKYHEEWVRNNARANERSRRNDRPRNADRSRNFERRRENMQQNQSFQSREVPPLQNQPYQNNPNVPPQNVSPAQNFASRDAPPMANQSYQTNPIPGPPNPDFNANRNIPPQNVSPPQNFVSRDAPPMANQSYQTNTIPGPPNPDFNANRNVPPPPPQPNPAYPNPMPNPSYQGGGGPSYQGYTGSPTPYQGGNQGYQGGSPGGGTGYQGSGPVYQGGSGGPPPYQGSYQGGNPGYQGSSPGYQGGNLPNYRPAGYQGPGSDHQAGGPGEPAAYQGRDVQGRDY